MASVGTLVTILSCTVTDPIADVIALPVRVTLFGIDAVGAPTALVIAWLGKFITSFSKIVVEPSPEVIANPEGRTVTGNFIVTDPIADVIDPTVLTERLLLEAGIGVPTALVIATDVSVTFFACLVVSAPTPL
jgi:hypothetical protein